MSDQEITFSPPMSVDTSAFALLADLQYHEPFASEALNRKFYGIIPPGIYRGFQYVLPGGMTLRIGRPSEAGSAIIHVGDRCITVQQYKPVDLVVAAGFVGRVVLEGFYQLGVKTKQVDSASTIDAVSIKLVTEAQYKPDHVTLYNLNVPANATAMQASYIIDAKRDDVDIAVDSSIYRDLAEHIASPTAHTKAQVGLSNVNNWPATASVNDPSDATYATAGAVKRAYDLAASKLDSGGTAAAATKLATPRQINGTNFDGTANITTANWGAARTLTIGNSGKSVNGGGNVSWSLAEIGAVNKAGDIMTGNLDAPKITSRGVEFFGDGDWAMVKATGKAGVILHVDTAKQARVKIGNANSVPIYHELNKPTSADVGLGNVNNWGATSAVNDASDVKYATASAVKKAYDLAASKLDSSANAVSATKLATPRQINGTNFDGTANITTANWGAARTLTIGNTAKSVNGGGNVAWSLAEIGAAPAGYGLGGNSATNSGSANRILPNGWYVYNGDSGDTDGPISYGNILSIGHQSNANNFSGWASQLFMGTNGGAYIRTSSANGTLAGAPWQRIYTTHFKPNPDDVGAVSATGGNYTGRFEFRKSQDGGLWPTNEASSANNYINRAIAAFSPGNNTLVIFGDTGENRRRMGIQSGHASSLYANVPGILELNPFGGEVRANGDKVYTTGFRPTAADVGAISKSGDTLPNGSTINDHTAGNLNIIGANNGFYGARGGVFLVNNAWYNGVAWAKFDNARPSGVICVRDGVPEFRYSAGGETNPLATQYRIYHSGYKPTANDVEALPITGGRLVGTLDCGSQKFQFKGYLGSTPNLDDMHSDTSGMWSYVSNAGGSNIFPVSNNANGLLTFNTHQGKYSRQIGFSSNGAMYTRYQDGSSWSGWRKMYDEANKPTLSELGAFPSSGGSAGYFRPTATIGGGYGLTAGNGDSASLTTNNIRIESWYGIGFWCTQGTPGYSHSFDTRNGNTRAKGDYYAQTDKRVYHEGFKPTASDVGLGNVPNMAHNIEAQVSTVPIRDGSGDIKARLFRSNYGSETGISASAGIAFRNSTSDDYVRFCSSPAAIRGWLGLSAVENKAWVRVASGACNLNLANGRDVYVGRFSTGVAFASRTFDQGRYRIVMKTTGSVSTGNANTVWWSVRGEILPVQTWSGSSLQVEVYCSGGDIQSGKVDAWELYEWK